MDWPFGLLFFVVVVLIMVAPMYRESKTFHKNLFYANDVSSVGGVSNVEVFDVNDKEWGQLIGLVFSSADEAFRLSITPKDAALLADWLEADARNAGAEQESIRKAPLGTPS